MGNFQARTLAREGRFVSFYPCNKKPICVIPDPFRQLVAAPRQVEVVATTVDNIIRAEGNSLVLKVGEYLLTLIIERRQPKSSGRIQLGAGQTLFDLVLDAARSFVKNFGENEFTAAALYHVAKERHPELDIRRNSWNSHVMSSAPNHPSYRHYTSHRSYFRYHGRGKYSLEPNINS